MKKLFLFLTLLITISSSSTKPLTTQDAQVCLRGAQATDAQILLNVIYWSYLRSMTTIAVQDVIFDHFKQGWMLWLNAASTRCNPRTKLPYPDIKLVDSTAANTAAAMQASVNKAYIYALENSVEQKSIISSAAIKSYIENVRSEARNAIAHTVVDSLTDLEKAFQATSSMIDSLQSKKFIQAMSDFAQEVKTNKNFINDGIDFLMNGFALQAFVQFDKKYIASSNQFFVLLAETQSRYSDVWNQLETTRAAYYKNIYGIVYATMVELNFPATSFLNAFNETGLIPAAQQINPLPASLL